MPIIKSAKKALRQNIKRREANKKKKDALKRLIKDCRQLAAEKKEEAKQMLPSIFKALDKSAKTNLIKKNKANRLKSRLSKLLKEQAVSPKNSR